MSEVKLENQRSYGHGGIAIGVRVSSLKERKVYQCLTCTKSWCDGCPKDWRYKDGSET